MFVSSQLSIMTAHSLSSFLEPLYTLAKFSGLFPFDDDLQLSEKWWKLSFLEIVLISVKGLGLRLYIRLSSEDDNSNYLAIFIEYINQSLSIAIMLSFAISIYRFKDKLLTLGKTMRLLSDGYAYKLQIPTVYTPLGSLMLILLFALNSSDNDDELWSFMFAVIMVLEIQSYLIAMSFCAFLEMIHAHFKGIINDIYSKSLEITTKKSFILISACENVCEVYGMPLLFMCMRYLTVMVVIGHSLSVDLHYFGYFTIDVILKRLFYKVAVILSILFNLVTLTGSCRKIQISLNRFNLLVFKEFRRRPNFVKNNMVKLYITKKTVVQFSACGFFSIDNSLVTSIMTTAVTYIVIFIQFNMPGPEKLK